MILALALLASLVPRASEDWVVLPLPALCQPARLGAHPPALWDGRHVRLSGGGADHEPSAAPPRLPVEMLAQMLSEDARAHGARIEFYRGTPALLARGDAAALAAARDRIAELDRAAAALDIEIAVGLTPSKERDTKGTPSSARIASGDEAFFGSRESRGFLGAYSVEVAANSGVAQPLVGTAVFGTTLHVRAARVDGGNRIHIFGVLDIAELAGVASFDPETPDLGVVQEPTVRSVQAIFAGVVDNGGTLDVTIAGAPLAQPDWSLAIQATTKIDATKSDGDRGWTLIDCSFLAADPPPIPACRPGAGLDSRASPVERAVNRPGLPPSAIAASLETGSDSSNAPRAPVHWSNQLLFVPNSESALLRSAVALARGVESLRLSTGRIEVQHGKLKANFPAVEGFPARLVAGVERSYLVGYSAEIAPQTWIASPSVEVATDGLCVDLDATSASATCAFWIATSRETVEIPRKESQLGKVQMLSRSLRADSARVLRDEPARSFLPALPNLAVPINGGKEPALEPLSIAFRAR